MTSEWITFYTTLTQLSIGLAGLLFISFSIYFTGFAIDPLEVKIGTSYYLEIISAFLISLSAILPPHWWWLGAACVSLFYMYYIALFIRETKPYKKAFYAFYDRSRKKKIEAATPTDKAEIYKIYKLQCEDNWIFFIRSIVLLLCAIEGFVNTIGIHIPILGVHGDAVAVEVAGVLTALYLVSSVIGAWLFFLSMEKRSKKKDKLELRSAASEGEKQNLPKP